MYRYMKEIYRAYENGMPVVGPTYISKVLGIKKSTAHHMLKNLAEMGYGKYIDRKGFFINSKGIEEGEKIIKKHRLIECFLAETFLLDKEKACMEAGKIDEYFGEELIKFIEEKFKYENCPCGNRIPE